ncbi:Fungal zn binuclear cluster domain containing protein [Colletotrichum higginsianum IMI 349063]|uniref:Fungal zn binuclear cluster domain containing protein n=1 Tax=Colletotrichum higginsianum (strain IMI 349063) TaxID=759273 RepID=A0A1B7YMW6_COLHI|nr:Fungal zn binuclear cluster domain containing protein [Colletotrichum higginsianum IMI 349063]OBR13228.1 Fungal zn binuclear cluster domain containing protein [Colletotrichum higginsianum IMI 349063]
MAQYAVPPASNLSPTSSDTPSAAVAASAQSQSQSGPPGAPQHKRVYQACIPCRRRKVRCDLGSVDNPHDPPCVRCRRESKECFFSATRRKRKAEDGDDAYPEDVDDYIVRNGRKRLQVSGSPPVVIDRRLYSEVPLTPGGSIGRNQPLRRPNDTGTSVGGTPSTTSQPDSRPRADYAIDDEPNARVENREAQDLMRPGVYGPHDALDLLYKAATDRSVQLRHAQDAAAYHLPAYSPATTNTHKRHESVASIPAMPQQPLIVTPGATMKPVADARPPIPVKLETQPIDPELTRRDLSGEPGYQDAIKAWGRFRFVRAGWFTAQEAIEYIDYYYEYLSPLTPISPPTFRNPASHITLLTEEPILTITLLTISSRYRKIPGTGGHCRSHAIHEQLWTYLRGMIERCLWGQEAFGGGFAAMAGASSLPDDQTSSTAPWRGMRKGSLRTLGTIESLMILTEWHPRALHFPPAEAIDELMLPSYEGSDLISTDENGNQRPPANIGGKRLDSWLEPAWRSDRMCWMLLSTAMGLAYELGVFDDIDEMLRDGAISRPEYEEEVYRQRAYRIKRLLLIYLTQLAGRLGWTSMVPETLRKSDPAVTRRRPTSTEGTTPGTNPSSMSNAFNYIPDLELDDQIIHCWAGISNAMHIGNEKLFRSRKHTTDIIQSGKYTEMLKDFQPLLQDWWKEFERYRLPPYIRHILTIEYEYVRIYVNSLSLQAVVERCTNNAGHTAHGNHNAGSAAQLSPQTQNYFGKLPLGQLGGFGASDQEYIKEVISGCRNLLRTVVEGLLPGDYLKHAPVRTYFRIISGAMFLLKTFALGAPRSDVKLSIDLMDETVKALRNCIVDDVHLGIRFADLLDSLTSRLRNRFIQAPALGQVGSADGRSPDPHAAVNGASAAAHSQQANGGDGQAWNNHATKLRDGLNAHGKPPPHRLFPPSKVTPTHVGALEDPTNISATPFDLSTGTFPYPSGTASVLGPSTPAAPPENGGVGGNGNGNGNNASSSTTGMDGLFDSTDWNNPGNEMWYLPPGPAFFQNMDNTAVAMTAEGVNVGGLDLLEYMAMDTGFPVMDGPSSYP